MNHGYLLLFQTIQQMLGLKMLSIKSLKSYIKYFKSSINTYNTVWKHSVTNKTPKDYITSNKIITPWNLDNDCTYKDINLKLEKFKKMFPLNAQVRLKEYANADELSKRSHLPFWSKNVYTIAGYKIPISYQLPIGIYLNLNNKQIPGVYYKTEIKLSL